MRNVILTILLGIAIGCQAYSGYADFNVGGIYYKILSTDNGEKNVAVCSDCMLDIVLNKDPYVNRSVENLALFYSEM